MRIHLEEKTIDVRTRQGAEEDRIELWPSMGEYPVYDETVYEHLSNATIRTDAYLAALRRAAPGRVCLDVGTGAHVNWARACVEAGARRVYAIEEMAENHARAAQKVRQLGMEDKIQVLHGRSTEITLPEPVDLCVSEIIGCIGSSEGAAAVLRDVRRRLLRPGGLMIPRRCRTWIAGVSLPEALRQAPGAHPDGVRYMEAIFRAVGRPFDVRLLLCGAGPQDLVSEPILFEDIDFNAPEDESTTHGTSQITRAARLDGLLAWVELWCDEEGPPVNALAQSPSWYPVFFPVFSPAIDVQPSDRIELTCRARMSSDKLHPDYELEGRIIRHAGGGASVPFCFASLHHGGPLRGSAYYRALFP